MTIHDRLIRFLGDGSLALLTAISTIGVVVSLVALIATSTPSYGQSDPPAPVASAVTADPATIANFSLLRGRLAQSDRMLDNHPAARTIVGAQP